MSFLEIYQTTLKVLECLPIELVPIIQTYISGTRIDWKTCRKHESALIEQYNHWTKQVFNEEALDWNYVGTLNLFPFSINTHNLKEYFGWTLYGRWYLILLTRENMYWFNRNYCPAHEPPFTENYKRWYRWQFHHLQNKWQRVFRI
jgi:hypothetical protein